MKSFSIKKAASKRGLWGKCVAGVSVLGMVATACGAAPQSVATKSASTHGPAFLMTTNAPWGTSWSYNYFSPDYIGEMSSLSLLPLAFRTPAGPSTYVPQLATSWKLRNGTLSVKLRKGVTWQNGQTVTSKDVLDTFLLNGIDFASVWDDAISSVAAPSRDEVTFKLDSGITLPNAEADILTVLVLPAREYAKFITPGLTRQVESYYRAVRSNPTTATNTAAGKALTALNKRLLDFSPPSVIGDGPYRVTGVTSSEVKFVKSPRFYGASKVRVGSFIWQETTASNNIGEMISGDGDLSWTGDTGPIYRKMESEGVKLVTPPFFTQGDIYYNSRHYPFNLLAVRQAVTYVINRPDLLELQDGADGFTWNVPVKHPALLYYAIEHRYLTKAQIDSLNTYRYNLTKAAKLLESVGFTKRNGQWYTPKGARFTITYQVPAGWTGEVASATIIPRWLDAFGIKTTGVAVEQPGYWTYQEKGEFEMDWGFVTGGGVDPLQWYANVLSGMNSGSTKTGNIGIGFGPVMNVPGLGKVNVPQTLTKEAETVPPGPQMKKLTWDWARLVNQELPVFSYDSKTLPIQYSTKHFTWPGKNSPLWKDLAFNTGGGMAILMESGQVRPR